MIVDIKKYREWMAWKKAINAADIKDIEWRLDGKKIEVDPRCYKEFSFLGMNNTDFPSLYLGEDGIKATMMFLKGPPPK